jgi:hypothetical protein
MKFAAIVSGCILCISLLPPASAQQLAASAHTGPQSSPWWVSGELGAGQITLSSDQQKGSSNTTFALGFAGGYQPSDWLRVGAHLNGWLLEAGDLYDPTKGVSVSNFGGIIDFMPSRRYRLFARAGFGLSMYTNQHPDGSYGSSPGWEAGGGYEIPIRGRIGLAPMVEYATGGLGNGSPTYPQQTGLRYSVIEFKLAVIGNFGHRR